MKNRIETWPALLPADHGGSHQSSLRSQRVCGLFAGVGQSPGLSGGDSCRGHPTGHLLHWPVYSCRRRGQRLAECLSHLLPARLIAPFMSPLPDRKSIIGGLIYASPTSS